LAVTHFNTSSIKMTGALINNTAFHSVQFSGVIANKVVKKGMYRIATCITMLSVIAATKNGFFHSGRTRRDSFSESEFMALNISIVTSIERLIVVARFAMSLTNISHPISGNMAAQVWKWLSWKNEICGPPW